MIESIPKYTPTTDGAIGLPVPVNDPVAPIILPVAVIVVDGEIPLPLIYSLVVHMYPFVVDPFPHAVMCPLVVIVPLVGV